MTGGVVLRNREANSWSEHPSGTISIVTDGMTERGKVPPPTLPLPRPTLICKGSPRNRAKIFAARARNSSFEVCNKASTGMSETLPQRCASVVTWSAARHSLSQRSARKSGSRLSEVMKRCLPAMMPACGPPKSLSPLKQTKSAPSFRASAGIGSCSSGAKEAVDASAPLPKSTTNGIRRLRASCAISCVRGDSTKPSIKKLLRCTLRIIAVLRLIAFL